MTLLHGGYPEAVARPGGARLWFSSYLQTYLERDVRAVTAMKDLATFRRFLALVASRHGQILNKTDLAAPLGVSVPTIAQWLGVLETTAQVFVVPPFYDITSATSRGLEVDFLVPGPGGAVSLVECKASRTVTPASGTNCTNWHAWARLGARREERPRDSQARRLALRVMRPP